MRVCGVICEYDPFHRGHEYLLRTLRETVGCDYLVCAMSGSFTQRGEPALFSKWARADMALRCGADAVFELPALFAVRDAQRFAQGGVALLAGLGVVTHLGFGSECGDLQALQQAAGAKEDAGLLRAGLDAGKAPGRARSEAAGLSLDAPNDVLAVEYLRALPDSITPVAVQRQGAGHGQRTLADWPSGTAIRAALARGEDVSSAIPAPEVLLRERQAGRFTDTRRFDLMLLSYLRGRGCLDQAADAGEGLENRLLRAAQSAVTREELLTLAKCKRYTWARLSRVATQGLLGITKALVRDHPAPEYARLLGFRQTARPLLARIRTQTALPVVLRPARFRVQGGEMLALDARAVDLWRLLCAGTEVRQGTVDWTTPPIRLETDHSTL